MKIDKQKLIDLLVKKTVMDPKDVEAQLNKLVSRIQDAAGKGKALEIKGFGMFYFSEPGDLTFDPSEELQTEVNYKYAGMEPVEIKKPRASSEPAASESEPESSDGDQEDISGIKPEGEKDQDKVEPGTGEQQEGEIRSSDKEVEKKDQIEIQSEETYDPFADFDHGLLKADDDNESKKSKPEPDTPVFDEQQLPELRDKSAGPETDKAGSVSEMPKSQKKSYKKPEKKERNTVTILVAAIVVVLVIVIGIVIAGDIGIFGDSDSSQEISQDEPLSMPAPPADMEAGAESEPEPEPEQQQEPEDGQNIQDQQQLTPTEDIEISSFGLHGIPQSIDGRYYSIILHSIRSESRAEQIREELQDQGYRAVKASVNNEEYGTMWRVGIGQFESVSNAQDAASELPQNYRDNHFIGILQ